MPYTYLKLITPFRSVLSKGEGVWTEDSHVPPQKLTPSELPAWS